MLLYPSNHKLIWFPLQRFDCDLFLVLLAVSLNLRAVEASLSQLRGNEENCQIDEYMTLETGNTALTIINFPNASDTYLVGTTQELAMVSTEGTLSEYTDK